MDKPQTYQIRKPTRVLITLAGGIVIIMLGAIAIVNGFWADNFQRVFHKSGRLAQTASISDNSKYKEPSEKSTSPFAREGLSHQEAEKVLSKGLEKQATPSAKETEDIGKAAKIHSSLGGPSEPKQTPASPPGIPSSEHVASIPLPHGFGRMEFEDEISPNVKKQLSKPPPPKLEINPRPPEEAKPLAQIPKKEANQPQETVSDGQSSTSTPSSPQSAPSAQVSSSSKLVVQAGESLIRIVNRNYPKNQKIAIGAVILANPAIVSEDTIYPGQILSLPEINFTNQTIHLKNHQFYATYGTYRSSQSLKVDTTWLAKKKIRFVVRNTKDFMGNAVHRVFLGGYATEEDLERALKNVGPKTR